MKVKFTYKVCNVVSDYWEEPFAIVLLNKEPVGKPITEEEARIVIKWLKSLTEDEINGDFN